MNCSLHDTSSTPALQALHDNLSVSQANARATLDPSLARLAAGCCRLLELFVAGGSRKHPLYLARYMSALRQVR